MPSAWVQHVQAVYRKGKAKGMSYKQAMVAAKKTYKKSGATKTKSASKSKKAEEEPEDEPEDEEEAPKKRKRRKKKA